MRPGRTASHRRIASGLLTAHFDTISFVWIQQAKERCRSAVHRMSPWLAFAFAMCLVPLTGFTNVACADEPAIVVAVSADELFIGETIDFQVEIQNVENPSAPDVSALRENFTVVPNGDHSRNQSSTFIINGRVSQQSVLSHIYAYRITPKISGDVSVPSVIAAVNGTELKSKPIPLRVQDAEEQDQVLVEITSDKTIVYPTQPFTLTALILVQPLPEGDVDPLKPLKRQPPHLQINWIDMPAGLTTNGTSEWLQPMISDDGTGFTLNEITASTGSFFGGSRAAVFDFSNGRETRNGLDSKPISYFVYDLSRTIVPEKTGQYSFGPALVKGTFVGGVRGTEYLARRLVAIAPSMSVEVREVPSPRPPNFTGGIGEYSLAASVSPAKLRVGDPITLSLEFSRGAQSGSLELIAAPDLSMIPEIADSFDIIDKSPTGRIEGSVKKFGYAMRPKRAGVSIPALVLTTFDPTSETFTELKTDSMSLDVAEASQLSSSEIVGAVPSTNTSEIRKSTAGIFQNITDPSELRDERINITGWISTVFGFWCLTGCVMFGVSRHRHRSSDVVGQRRSQARRLALSRLNDASRSQTAGQSKEALRIVRTAIVGLVADVKNSVGEGLTTADVDQALSEALIPETDRTSVVQLLRSIEDAEYGGGNSLEAASAIQSATLLVERIGPVLERSVSR